MLYYCLTHRKKMKGLGVPPHLSYKHGGKNLDLKVRMRQGMGNDYFVDGKLTVVCLGNKLADFTDQKTIDRIVAAAQAFWDAKLPRLLEQEQKEKEQMTP